VAWKDPEKQREAIRKHYYANKEYYIEKARKQKAELRDWLYKLKASTPCTDCGIIYPSYVTDYDHIGDDKVMNISKLINRGSAKKVKEEIKKCELVCANCHRERTYQRLKKNTV
jgi:hypothetical protein